MVKCGNHQRHGKAPVYHATAKLVQKCFEGGEVYNLDRQGAFLNTPAPVTFDPVRAAEVFARLRRAGQNGQSYRKAAHHTRATLAR